MDPGRDESAPILRNEVEHSGARLALELERLEMRKAAREAVRRGGVAERHGDVLARDGVDLVPSLADERHRVPVARVVHVGDDALPDRVVGAAAAETVRFLRSGVIHSSRN